MWLITTDGFYSIVDKQNNGYLTVRARSAADLDRLRARLPELGATLTGAGTDYPHRAVVRRDHLAAAVARIAADIDYSNFKNEVAAKRGRTRAHALGEVWHALLQLEREDDQ